MRERFKTIDELVETMYRGNELVFYFREKEYFLLPYFNEDKVNGFRIGEACSDGELLFTKQELQNYLIQGNHFEDILSEMIIFQWNF